MLCPPVAPLLRAAPPIVIAWMLLSAYPCAATEAGAVFRWLAGNWTGGGISLRIDPERLQANTDPDKPFHWEAFRLRNVTGCMVTFDIGPRRYVGLMFRDRVMHVNTYGWPGEQNLRDTAKTSQPVIPCPDEPRPVDPLPP